MTNLLPEAILIKYLLNYNIYSKYYIYIKDIISKDLREVKTIYNCLEILHKINESDKSIDDLAAIIWASYPQMRQPEREAINDYLTALTQVEVQEDAFNTLVESVSRRSKAEKLATTAYQVYEGKDAWAELQALCKDFEEDKSAVKSIDKLTKNFVTCDLDELQYLTSGEGGLHWRLNCLNRSIGPLRRGDFGFLFARPESGKTTFLASEVSYMAGQTELPILWFNNEEQGGKVRLRTFQAALGVTDYDLWRDRALSRQAYLDLTGDRIKIYDDASISKQDVEAVIAEYPPSLIIFDQIDKIRGFDADRRDLVFGQIYQWARELSKTYAPVIGVCQADGTGEGVLWLTMGHVAEAKTSKQAEADWILGIGRSNERNTEDIRYLNISKNKLLGDENTDPNERHGRFEVFIRPQIARYEDIE